MQGVVYSLSRPRVQLSESCRFSYLNTSLSTRFFAKRIFLCSKKIRTAKWNALLSEHVEKPNVSRYHLADGSLSQRFLNGPMLACQEKRQKAKRLSRLADHLAKRVIRNLVKWSATVVHSHLHQKSWAFPATSFFWNFRIAFLAHFASFTESPLSIYDPCKLATSFMLLLLLIP